MAEFDPAARRRARGVRPDPTPDGEDTAVITPYEDGPLLVRGRFAVRTPDGQEIDPGRRTIALCRCGLSARKPFCDGTHRIGRFRAGSGPDRHR
jgi:CDGSH-type Zn-finger protein